MVSCGVCGAGVTREEYDEDPGGACALVGGGEGGFLECFVLIHSGPFSYTVKYYQVRRAADTVVIWKSAVGIIVHTN